MKALFREVLDIEGVEGVMLLDSKGKIQFEDFNTPKSQKLNMLNGQSLVDTFQGIEEAELLFDHYRVYVRKAGDRMIVVFAPGSAQIAMVRLNCNILIPSLLEKLNKPKGLGRFFKRK